MATTLAALRDRVEQVLADSGNAIWSTDDMDEAIRRALHEYSQVRPQQVIGTLTLVADGRELSTATLTGILDVREIWCDYTAADPEFPPNIRPFEYWPDSQIIYVTGSYEPQSGDVCRVFYTLMQALKDLDAATATTFPDDDESIIAGGAAGYAATSRAVDLAEQVTLDRLTAQQIRAWGMAQLQRFRADLKRVAEAEALRAPATVQVGKLDVYEGEWS